MSLERLVQIGFLSILSPLVMGFEGEEHRIISDQALSIAFAYQCGQPSPSAAQKCKDIETAVRALTDVSEKELSYGQINQVVDYMHYPEMVFNTDPYRAPEEALNDHVWELLTRSLDRFVLFDYLSASSHNERHFQYDMMKSMDSLHRAAINEARDGRMFRALVYNALSDHYLNDFFAPGHVTTQRENSHDMVALAMHDWSNKAGTCFKIEPDEGQPDLWEEELEEILEFIESRNEPLIPAITNDEELADANLAECGNANAPGVAGLSQEELQQEIIANLMNNNDKIYLKGDGRLLRNPKQKLFMLLVQVRSILEVMGSYIECLETKGCEDPTQSVTTYEWSDSYDKGEIVAPKAKIRYGKYLINNDEEETVRTFFIPVGYRPKYAYPVVADNGFLLSFGGQSLEHEPARYEAQLELFPMKIGSAWEWMRNTMAPRPSTECETKGGMLCNVGLAWGITHFQGDDLDGTGGQLRIIKALPKISGHMSLIVRRSKYDGTNVKSWENAYGIRYDHGFSLHSFYIGFQRDYGLDSNGSFGRENVVTFGWNLTFPSSRFLGFFGGYK